MNAHPAMLVLLLVSCATFGKAVPTPQNGVQTTAVTSSGSPTILTTSNLKGQMFGSSQIVSATNDYVVKVSESQVNNECVATLSIVGNGINKTVNYTCGKAPTKILNFNQTLSIGNEWYSDQHGILVHVENNQCQREVFTENDGKFTSTTETLSDDECQKVRDKIVEMKNQQQKWKEWIAQQQLAIQQQFQQWQQNMLQFQQQLFGTLFGGK